MLYLLDMTRKVFTRADIREERRKNAYKKTDGSF